MRATTLGVVLSVVWIASGACTSWRSWHLKNVEPSPVAEFDAPLKARKAYALLRDTRTFSSAHVGAAGIPAGQVVAFQTLLSSRSADEGFKLLLSTATLEGQLYGLSGLYFTDGMAFRREIERYRSLDKVVNTEFGCVGNLTPLSSIISSSAVIGPEDLSSWHRENPLEEYPPVDIATGGWSTEFRDAYKQR